MNDEELSTELEKWFEQNFSETKPKKKHLWERNQLAAVLKKYLIKLDHWKARAKVNKEKSKASYKKMKQVLAERVKPTEELSPKKIEVIITEKESPKIPEPPKANS